MTARLLDGRRAVVTGGANGLGAGIVRRLAAAGATGAVLDLPAAPPGPLPAGWSAVEVDLRDDASADAAFSRVADVLPEIDVLVAAAGVVPAWADIASQDLAEWDDVFAVNARGVIGTIQRALPRMGEGGAIVVIASLNGWRGDPNLASYVASKHAAVGIVRAAALDLGRQGIRVNAVAPGPIATDALLARMKRREHQLGVPVAEALEAAGRGTALRRMATVDEVASATLFLASDLSSGVTGHLLPVDAGIA